MPKTSDNEIDWRAHILFEDESLLVVDKPAGVLSQKDKSGDADLCELLVEWFRAQGKSLKFLAPVHRLDRNTSGVILLAKSSQAAAKLTGAIRDRKVRRHYLAIVKGDPGESGTIDAPLAKDEEENKSEVSESGSAAITKFVRKQKLAATSIVEVELETGRSHQIRAHFAHIKCPLLGDVKYGKKPWSAIFHRPALHAETIEFPNPQTGKAITISAPIPKDLAKLIQQIGG